MKQLRAALVSAIVLLSLAPAAADESVTLTSLDGALELSGIIIDYDGVIYRIESEFGPMTVSADMVTCAGARCPEAGAFVAEWAISGAPPGADVLLPALLEAFARREGLDFARQNGDSADDLYALTDPETGADVARVRVRVTSAGEGFADLSVGVADMAIAAREPDAAELSSAADAGIGQLTDPVQSRLLALDALVAVVHPSAKRDAMSVDQLARLIGNPEETPVHVTAQAAASGALAMRVLARSEAKIGDPVVRHATAADLFRAVSAQVNAMGVTMLSDARGLRRLALQGTCGARLAPDVAAIKAEDYPLTVAHYLYLPRRRLPAVARRFSAFVTSESAQAAVRAAGFVDQTVETTPLSAQGDRLSLAMLTAGEDVDAGDLRRMMRALTGADRLTPTFRFRDGSSELNGPSRANVSLVARAIANGAFDGGELLMAGFSDGLGGAAANLALSRERSAAVRAAIEAALPAEARARVGFDNQGFGEALPMACDEDDWGRSVNRRVELWLRQR